MPRQPPSAATSSTRRGPTRTIAHDRGRLQALIGTIAVSATLIAGCAAHPTAGAPPLSATASATSIDGQQISVIPEVSVQRIFYPTPGGGDPKQNWGDLYLPAGPQQLNSIALVVLIHGGAWASDLGAGLFDPFARDLAARGLAVYNIEYRRLGSGGGWPTTFEDVAHALDNVVSINTRFPQLETGDSVVVGHSAGAQLAVWAGTRHRLAPGDIGSNPRFRPTKVISLAGPLDMVQAVANGDNNVVRALGGTPASVPARYASVDPIQNIDPGTPVVAIHGTADAVVLPSLSKRYVDAVRRDNGNGKLILLDGVTHTSIVSPKSPSYGRILDIITETENNGIDKLDE